MENSTLIVGHGYFGGHLSKLLIRDSFELFATTRSEDKFETLHNQSVSPILFDVLNENASRISNRFQNVIYCVGFDRSQSASRRQVYVDGLQNFLTKLDHPPAKFVYVSSTGVYGQSDGAWVTELSPTEPNREGGIVCVEAEKLLAGWFSEPEKKPEVTILRLAGIYGPGRIPNRAKLESGLLNMNGDGFLNLVHVADASALTRQILNAKANPGATRIWNVSDGAPGTRREYYRYLAQLLDVPPPDFQANSGERPTRGDGSKRVSNQKLIEETGYQFCYPSYREGLWAIVGKEDAPNRSK